MTGVALWIVLAVVAGAILSVQAGVNTLLAQHVGGALQATMASFAVGSVAVLAALLVRRSDWPGISRLLQTPLPLWSGGLLGACYVAAIIILSRRLGAATLFGLVVAGQMTTAVVLDQFGALGFAQHSVSLARIAGILLIVAGVVLVRAF